jgi:hypothetical protein
MNDIPKALPPDLWDAMFCPVKVKTVRLLAEFALIHLEHASSCSPGHAWRFGNPCNPDTCNLCWALRELLNDRQLDALLYHSSHGPWWDDETNTVDRNWLALRWGGPPS